MPLPPFRGQRPQSTSRKADNELLFKGLACALIGAVVLLAPYLARADSVRGLMQQAYLVGWFALVLGGAFLVRYALLRWRRKR
ncbi:hypothetical protein PY257_08925 [Ramlibacter sp. H39-3-26]|uniref:hypothetical protein n=1 Tax=Curvibacter soli TaxID=3031331 RepID=UPI0023D9D760|nr:hypothetical protein [Ramlibacter sp. H39-3-26]MDF1485298.1 hypothetical protein [Ramlibacter sp. H39-3-26]